MAVSAFALDSRQSQLDSILEQVCLALQLTEAQYEDAKGKYETVGKWLSADSSSLLRFKPLIYPQGSMRTGTTNRPWRGTEFDLDLVCQLHGCGGASPLAVYDAVYRRMANNALYLPILERKACCVRLNYSGSFHLDIIPACPDERLGGTIVKVPNRDIADWKTSNPIGFAEIFFDRCKLRAGSPGRGLLMKDIRPLPNPVPSQFKFPLQRIVQLMKRERDCFFEGDIRAARSVVLTTLAGVFYAGEQSLSEGLFKIISGILGAVEAYPGILPVLNPSNPGENFSDGWTAESYESFKSYLRNFRRRLDVLFASQGLESTAEAMGGMFGKDITSKAIKAYGAETEQFRHQSALRMTPKTGALTTLATGIAIPRNNFYGRG